MWPESTLDVQMKEEGKPSLTQSSGFSFRLHQAQDVVLSDWALDVSDDGSGSVFQELNSNLGDTTSRTGSAQNLDNLSKSNWSLSVLMLLVYCLALAGIS